MLRITVPTDDFVEYFDEESSRFLTRGGFVLELEHSLASLSKWESIFEKPFLGGPEKTPEELLGYVEAMTLTPDVPPEVYHKLSEANILAVNEYLDRRMTATWFSEIPGATPKSRDVITAELIYYWLTVFSIPFECEHWHLNRLFTLIQIANIKTAGPKRMSRSEIAARNRKLNEQRKAQYRTRG